MTSPGTSSRAAGVTHLPSRLTRALIASWALRASIALPAWCSSQKPTVALAKSRTRMMKKSGQCRSTPERITGGFDHPGDGTPEVGQQLQQRIGLLLGDLVGPVLAQPLLRLGLAEAVGREPKRFSTSARGRDFRSSFASGLESGCASGASGSGSRRVARSGVHHAGGRSPAPKASFRAASASGARLVRTTRALVPRTVSRSLASSTSSASRTQPASTRLDGFSELREELFLEAGTVLDPARG